MISFEIIIHFIARNIICINFNCGATSHVRLTLELEHQRPTGIFVRLSISVARHSSSRPLLAFPSASLHCTRTYNTTVGSQIAEHKIVLGVELFRLPSLVLNTKIDDGSIEYDEPERPRSTDGWMAVGMRLNSDCITLYIPRSVARPVPVSIINRIANRKYNVYITYKIQSQSHQWDRLVDDLSKPHIWY